MGLTTSRGIGEEDMDGLDGGVALFVPCSRKATGTMYRVCKHLHPHLHLCSFARIGDCREEKADADGGRSPELSRLCPVKVVA